MAAWIGPAIAAGASLLGGWLGKESQEKQQQQNQALQKEFAQSSIQWKVADAKKAGIHPLYALGSPSISPAVSVQNDPMAAGIANAGQDISRAMLATGSQETRQVSGAMQTLALERASLQNEVLKTQLVSMRARMAQGGQTGPAMPVNEVDPFAIGQSKVEDRPPIMMGGERVRTDPGTSPAKAFEDWLGDDLFSPGFLPNLIGAARANFGHPATWPQQMVTALWNSMRADAKAEYGNFQNFARKLTGRGSYVGDSGGGW